MTARTLLMVFDSVYLLAMTSLVGSIAYFSFGVAPVIFKVLGHDAGGRFVRALFPRYYVWGAMSGAVALPAFVAGPLCVPEYRGPGVGIQAMVILGCILIMLYAGNSLTPAINEARDAGVEGEERFSRLHRRSVRLNGLVLLAGVVLLIAFAARKPPVTAGIIEPALETQAGTELEMRRVVEGLGKTYRRAGGAETGGELPRESAGNGR